MANRNRTSPVVYKQQQGMPKYPERKWWQHIPGFGKGYDDQLGKYQNDYNLWMWNQQNKYDEPAQQKDRWEQAGLSSNLMYGQGDSGNSASATPAERSSDTTGNADLGGVIGRFMDSRMKLAQIKDVESAAQLKSAQSVDLLKDIDAKDTVWTNMESKLGTMTPRQRAAYQGPIKQYHELMTQYQKSITAGNQAEGSKYQASILKKIDALKNTIMVMQMVSGGLGAIARFK